MFRTKWNTIRQSTKFSIKCELSPFIHLNWLIWSIGWCDPLADLIHGWFDPLADIVHILSIVSSSSFFLDSYRRCFVFFAASSRPLELHSYDTLRYVTLVLGWIHQVVATEKDYLASLLKDLTAVDPQTATVLVFATATEGLTQPLRSRLEHITGTEKNVVILYKIHHWTQFYIGKLQWVELFTKRKLNPFESETHNSSIGRRRKVRRIGEKNGKKNWSEKMYSTVYGQVRTAPYIRVRTAPYIRVRTAPYIRVRTAPYVLCAHCTVFCLCALHRVFGCALHHIFRVLSKKWNNGK